jgi:hypothetical protein
MALVITKYAQSIDSKIDAQNHPDGQIQANEIFPGEVDTGAMEFAAAYKNKDDPKIEF